MIDVYLGGQSLPIFTMHDSSMRPFLKSSQLFDLADWKADFSGAATLSAQNHHDRRWLHKSETHNQSKNAVAIKTN